METTSYIGDLDACYKWHMRSHKVTNSVLFSNVSNDSAKCEQLHACHLALKNEILKHLHTKILRRLLKNVSTTKALYLLV